MAMRDLAQLVVEQRNESLRRPDLPRCPCPRCLLSTLVMVGLSAGKAICRSL
jgi:hypothetical protein